MNDIEVGEYVRSKCGYIARVISVDEEIIQFDRIIRSFGDEPRTYLYMHNDDVQCIGKHSKNIIDVLEVGDYVNGSRIMEADSVTGYMKEIYLEEAPDYEVLCEEIKTILTHEQYEANCYRLEK